MASSKAVHGELRMFGPVDTPRERLCARLFQELLLKLQEKSGMMPVGAVVALQWRGENGGTKMFTAAADAEAFQDINVGVFEEIKRAGEMGAQAAGPGDEDEDEDDEEPEDEQGTPS